MGQILPDNKNDRVAQQRIKPRELAREPGPAIGVAAIRWWRQAGQNRQALPQAQAQATQPLGQADHGLLIEVQAPAHQVLPRHLVGAGLRRLGS